jgi:predicted nucleic acid-binding protein
VDIKLLPATTKLLIDATILIYHLGDSSAECTDFLKRVAVGEIEAYVTTTILAEVLHRRMTSEALAKGLITSGQPIKKLKANPLIITSLTDYITDIEDILTFSLKVIEITLADITASHQLRQSYGLFVNDSVNIACAQRLGISNIVTRDNDFSAVSGITVWQPTDI